MTKPYKIVPLKEAFPDYPGGAKAFLTEHGDFVNKPKDAFVVLVEDDFYSDLDGGHDLDDMFGEALVFDYADDKTICAILFKKNCNIPNMCYVDREIEYAPALIVKGNLTARALNLAGGHTLINGNCDVREAIYGHYNHGELTVNGTINTPLIIADDCSMLLNGVVNTQYTMGTAWKTLAPKANVPVWDVTKHKKEIKAVMDKFYMDEYGFDSELINIALMVGDCLLKEKPANAKKRKKSDYFQLSSNVKAILDALEAQYSPVKSLQLGGYHMGEFPSQFRPFTSATFIDLHNNSIKALPTWLAEFANLQHLDVSTNDIKKLPLSPTQLVNLESLNIRDTLINTFGDNNIMPNLSELSFGKKDYGNGGDEWGRMAIDFDWRRTPNLQHLHINQTGWFWPWDTDFGFYQCKQLKYLHFGYEPTGAMGKHLSQLQQLEFYGYETGSAYDENDYSSQLDIDTLASLPNLAVLYVASSGKGFDKTTIQTLRKRLPNLYISAPYLDADFAQDDAFEAINAHFDKLQNYQDFQPKNEANVQKMLNMIQQYHLEISPKWFDKTWENIFKHMEGKARNCDNMQEKSTLIKQFYDTVQLAKPFIPKTASWTHLLPYGYDLWEYVQSVEIWYVLRRADFNATHLAWALQQLAICLAKEQKRLSWRKRFASLQDLADELAAELAQ
jgi:hypothetical protein